MIGRKKVLLAMVGTVAIASVGTADAAYAWGLPGADAVPTVCKNDNGAEAMAKDMDNMLYAAYQAALLANVGVEIASGHKDEAEKTKAQHADATKAAAAPDGATVLANLEASAASIEAKLKELESHAGKLDAAAKKGLEEARSSMWSATAQTMYAGVLAVPVGKAAKDAIAADKTCSTKLVKIADTAVGAAKTVDRIVALKVAIDKVAEKAGLKPLSAEDKAKLLASTKVDVSKLPAGI